MTMAVKPYYAGLDGGEKRARFDKAVCKKIQPQ
ncbi:hypothetical protein CfE428DRAFT_6038 [Chthoniobacter flavus Ellin428]|uniref:Uncharacterized protein n=1 Tax=Chthoniobacter flavus Ellin428 TaxID=497964 RepID=B4DAU7_9BACT|nr:hypothetical protein CfE428DRAFT_6038 [Chthoniobacter flavus Ellin428]